MWVAIAVMAAVIVAIWAVGADAGSWTSLPAHPWAADYPSDGGNTYHEDGSALVDLQDYGGHLYAGYGTTYGGRGPCEGCTTTIAYFDGSRWVSALSPFESEGIWVYRTGVGKGVATVALDNKGSAGLAHGEPWTQHGPGTRRTGDVAQYQGAIYVVGSAGGPKVWRSDDNGASWREVFFHDDPEGMFCGAAVLDGKLFVFEGDWFHCHAFGSYDDVFSFDGSAWEKVTTTDGHWKPTVFDGRLAVLHSAVGQGSYQALYLMRPDGSSHRTLDDAIDLAVDGSRLFALTEDGAVMRMEDADCSAGCWQTVTTTPGGATSLEVSGNTMHVGGSQGRLWRYEGDPSADTGGGAGPGGGLGLCVLGICL